MQIVTVTQSLCTETFARVNWINSRTAECDLVFEFNQNKRPLSKNLFSKSTYSLSSSLLLRETPFTSLRTCLFLILRVDRYLCWPVFVYLGMTPIAIRGTKTIREVSSTAAKFVPGVPSPPESLNPKVSLPLILLRVIFFYCIPCVLHTTHLYIIYLYGLDKRSQLKITRSTLT
jgi:hypothetical protein